MKLPQGKQYVNGEWVSGEGISLLSKNPLNGTTIWQGFMGHEKDIKAAIHAADEALSHWSLKAYKNRIPYLEKFASIVNQNQNSLIQCIAEETGKPLWEAATEVKSVVGKIPLAIKAYEERSSEKYSTTADTKSSLRFKPHGIVAVLGAFNFPAHLSNGHIVPALLAGNTVVYKPSELTPATAAFIMQCWHETGLPKGVINCVFGDKNTGTLLLNADIQGVYFTGSYQTGKAIHQLFSERPEIILALEMGGNNPLVIDAPKNYEAAIYNTILSAFLTAGQRCTAARRLLIKDNREGEDFLSKLIKACKKIKVGAYTDKPEPFMGPVISHEHALLALKAEQNLRALGGHSLLNMSLLRENSGLLSPGIIDMSRVLNPPDEEIFAPFLQVYRYKDFDEAIDKANQTRFGLVASLFSDNPKHFEKFFQKIHAGLINWNKPTTGAASSLPFGGVGCSGNHRPSAYFAADYCAYPVASLEETQLSIPKELVPGIHFL